MLSKRADVLESSFQRFLSHYQFLIFRAITFDAAKVRRLNGLPQNMDPWSMDYPPQKSPFFM